MSEEIEDDGEFTLYWSPPLYPFGFLRALYNKTLAEPVPEHLQSLIERLPERDRERR
jgi:hypothetical protein